MVEQLLITEVVKIYKTFLKLFQLMTELITVTQETI